MDDWLIGDCCIGEVEEYTVEGRNHGGLKSMGDRMKEEN